MKLFKVCAGTRGHLLVDEGVMPTLRSWTVRRDMIFEREDLVLDPVNVGREFPHGSATLGYRLAKDGWSLFNPPRDDAKGWKNERRTVPKYCLVVPFREVEVMQ